MIPHGTRSGYSFHRCRCFRCRVGQANYQRAYRLRRIKRERAFVIIEGQR